MKEQGFFSKITHQRSNLAAPKSYQSDIKRRILFYNSKEKNSFISCNIYGENCKNLSLNQKDYLKAISQSLKDDKKMKLSF